LVFCCVLCTWVWVNNTCCVVWLVFILQFGFARVLLKLQILLVSESWSALRFWCFINMFFMYKSTRGKPLTWSQGPLFCCFSFLFSYLFYFLFPFFSPSFCLSMLVPCRYSSDGGNRSHHCRRQELKLFVAWLLMLVRREKQGW